MRADRRIVVLAGLVAGLGAAALAAAADLCGGGAGDAGAAFRAATDGLGAGRALRFDGLAATFDVRLGGADATPLDPVNGGPDAAPRTGEPPR